jgi:calcineurin-like phosphoesterase family protein
VHSKDTVYHLGDVAIPRSGLHVLEQLNGRKILIRGNHDCLDEATEILTNMGWKQHQEINTGDYCWSMGPNKIGEWMPITEVIRQKHQGKMVSLETGRLSMLMTHNHRVASFKNNEIDYFMAGALIDKTYKSICQIPTASSSDFPGLNISDSLLCLSAWVLTDGVIGKRGHYREVHIYQSKPNGIKRIKSLLKTCGAEYSVTSRGIKKQGTIVCGKALKKDSLEAFVFKIKGLVAKEILTMLEDAKTIPEYFFKMTMKQAHTFVRELMEGDGSWAKSHNSGALHGKLGFLESVLTLCVTHGINATITPVTNRENHVLNINFLKTTKLFQRSNAIKTGKLKEVDYDGAVWCITTPYTNFLARRNGIPFFTGNCFKLRDYAKYFEDIRGCHFKDKLIFCHIPVHRACFEGRYKGCVHGHLHVHQVMHEGNPDPFYFNTCVERNNFTPVSLDAIRQYFGL